MASMNTCPGELRMMFVEHVHDGTSKSLNSLALVNKSFHQQVKNFRLRSWTFRHGNLTEDVGFIKDNKVEQNIRRVHLMDYMAVKPNFCMLLPAMTMLRDIEMVCGFGHENLQNTILKYLQSRPEIRLHVTVSGEPIRPGRVHTQTICFQGFMGCQNLHSLSVKHRYNTIESCIEVTRPLKHVLLTCPNLRHLTLDIKSLIGGLMHYCGFGFVDDERIPAALETLEVIAYPFGKKDTHPHLFQPNIPGYPVLGYEQRYWTNRFDWSNLTRLNIRDTWAWLPHLKKLTSLKEVDLTSDPCTEFASKFLRGVPTKLESIKVHQLEDEGWNDIVLHGTALRVLHITGDGRQPMGNMSIEHETPNTLTYIREGCPYIEDLGISFTRDDLWPDEILREVSRIKRVRKVTLYFDYTNRNFNNRKLNPAVTFKGAWAVHKYLAVWSEGKEYYPLREVRLVSGIFRPPKNPYSGGRDTQQNVWTDDSSITIVCQTPDQDNVKNTVCRRTWCPDLTEDENEILDVSVMSGPKAMMRLVDRSLTPPRLKTVSPKFKLAWAGPMSYAQWQDYRNWIYKPGKPRFFQGNGIDYIVEDEDDWYELRRRHQNPPLQG